MGIIRMIGELMLVAGENRAPANHASIFDMVLKRKASSLELASGCPKQLLDIVALSVERPPRMQATNSVEIIDNAA